ncbi:hypothetical protein M441DRAFT_363457 [Trichoderma asperellum CBS 433.97]|uniref:Uncharacterized protein n=1 Tax=Trichoderma asperellum (strain ATCC 204424 / CBS 433.97 / NBRC 101777) TaxID=1042311 RepID=A0A2T3ZDY3_TRIA4|nr:hypothetical protein M441DRAFT_363457 [Trichoderma asperellum CBS 433.97]PTB43022.1 hypothetical protein M441DRAFT_363457 [Trichoderma asperellum CBS 433.97]
MSEPPCKLHSTSACDTIIALGISQLLLAYSQLSWRLKIHSARIPARAAYYDCRLRWARNGGLSSWPEGARNIGRPEPFPAPQLPSSHISLVMFVMKPLAQCVILFLLVARAVDCAKRFGATQVSTMGARKYSQWPYGMPARLGKPTFVLLCSIRALGINWAPHANY